MEWKRKQFKDVCPRSSLEFCHCRLEACLQMTIPRALLPVSCCPFVGGGHAGDQANLRSTVYLQRSRSDQKEKEQRNITKQKPNPVFDGSRAESGFCEGGPTKKHSVDPIRDTTSEPQNTPGSYSPGTSSHLPKMQGCSSLEDRLGGLAIKQRLPFSAHPTLTRQEGFTIGWLGLKECYFGWGQGWFINKCTGLLQYRSRLLFSGHGRPSGYVHLPWLS